MQVNIDTYSDFVLLLIVLEIQICAKAKQTIFEMYVASSIQTYQIIKTNVKYIPRHVGNLL